jgi:Zn-dependent protease
VESETALERLRRIEQEEQAAREGRTPGAAGKPAEASKRNGIIAFLAFVLFFIVTKGKVLLTAIKLGPLLTTMSTMYLSVWAYSLLFGWKLAAAFVIGILIHELGHGVAAKVVGLPVSAPIFIPFLGAFIMLKDRPKTTWQECVVGVGGPIAGLMAGVVMLLVGVSNPSSATGAMLIVAAWLTFKINMFNLIPAMGLDGDRISRPFRSWYWLLVFGGVIGIVYQASLFMPLEGDTVLPMAMVVVVGLYRMGVLFKREQGEPKRLLDRLSQPHYVEEAKVPDWQRYTAAVLFFAVFALLCVLSMYANSLRPAVVVPVQ